MCGITGIISNRRKLSKDLIDKMSRCLVHRGPDENNSVIFENCALGHARLSIIDLTHGQQPMRSQKSDTAIVFNGEIYGYQEIKKDLRHYPFQNDSDTEVILALYDKYGKNMVKHLPGAFSFGIWDNKQQSLLLARDRFGEKPLYYAISDEGDFIFASEIKSIIASGLITPKLSTDSMAHMLMFFHVHPHKTIYENIHVLKPAHQIVYKNGKIIEKPYWSIPALNNSLTADAAAEGFQHYFQQAIRRTLIADVPVGVFLSGGLDSSTIAIEASKLKPHISTISFGYAGSPLNELPYARAVAEMCGTDHHELTDTRDDLADLFLQMVQLHDEPFGDMSQIPLYLISQHARKLFTVVLDGSGADELLAGYGTHWGVYQKFAMNTQGSILSKSNIKWQIINTLHNVSSLFGITVNQIERRYDRMKFDRPTTPLSQLVEWMKMCSEDTLQMLKIDFSKEFVGQAAFNPTETIEDALLSDVTRYLPGDILVKGDRISMANSLEMRLPFLEKDLAEFLLSVPMHLKTNGTIGKIPMRQSYESEWPEALKNRPKQGFNIPYDLWYEREDFKNIRKQYILNKNSKIYDYMDYDQVTKICKKSSPLAYNLLFMSAWLEKNI